MSNDIISSHKYWCPQCQRHFAKLTLGEDLVSCPACGTPSREIDSTSYMRRVLDSFLSGNEFSRQESSNTSTSDMNPLMEEIARRRPSIENSPQPIIQESPNDTHSVEDMSTTESINSIPNEPLNLGAPLNNEISEEVSTGQPRRRRLMLIHTIFITGPHGGIVIRTGHMLPETDQHMPDSQEQPEAQQTQSQIHEETQQPEPNSQQNHHHSGLLDLLGRLNPLRLLRRDRHHSENTQNEQRENQTDSAEILRPHHARSDPINPEEQQNRPEEEQFPSMADPGLRIFMNPLDLFSNGFVGLDQLLEQIFSAMPEHQGVPPASDESMKKVQEFEYQMGKESDMCAICHDDFQEKQTISKLPCSHSYHKDCVNKWLKMHGLCPVCRSPLEKESQTVTQEQ